MAIANHDARANTDRADGYAVPGTVIAIGILVPVAALDQMFDRAASAWLGVSTGRRW